MGMTKTIVTVAIDIEVFDEKVFRQKAKERALEDGLSEEDAAGYLDEECQNIGACAQMLFDPGISPDGCEIIQSSAE
jgi:hypothetical protein